MSSYWKDDDQWFIYSYYNVDDQLLMSSYWKDGDQWFKFCYWKGDEWLL